MGKEQLSFVVVGHVDHGKSTLIGRLLYDTDSLPKEKIEEVKSVCAALGKEFEFAYILDHLEEERKQGITIDIAHIFFKTDKREYLIIDAPGHREFTKNMITGASHAEAAVLIVDATEGVQEQTRRHAYILKLLGLEQVVVVINKMDAVEYSKERFEEVLSEVASLFDTLGIKPAYVIPISAKEGDNVAEHSSKMPWYSGPTILEALDTFRPAKERDDMPFRMAVQDVYNIDGKRIIVGRVESGTVSEGDSVKVLPSGEVTRVASIEKFLDPDKKKAFSGESIGITTQDKLFLDRGYILCDPDDTPKMVRKIQASLFWMSKEPLKKGETVQFKCSTQEVPCMIEKIEKRMDSSTLEVLEEDAEKLNNREVGEVILSFEDPVIVEDFNKTPSLGKFVIEKGYDISGGGIITHMSEGE